MTLHVQFMTIIMMICGGFYLGIAHETYRRFAVYWKRRYVLVFIYEITFWVSQMIILYYILFKTNHGELRFYVFLACLLGFSMYQVLFKSLYQKILERMILILSAILRAVKRTFQILIIRPIYGIIQMIIALLLVVVQVILWILNMLWIIVSTPIRLIFKLLYKLSPNVMKKFLHKLSAIYSIMTNKCKLFFEWIQFRRR